MSCGVGHRSSIAVAVATAPIRPLAWELPYAVSMALKNKQTKNKKKPTVIKTNYLKCYEYFIHDDGGIWLQNT